MKLLINLVEINIAAMIQDDEETSESEEVPYVETEDENNKEDYYGKTGYHHLSVLGPEGPINHIQTVRKSRLHYPGWTGQDEEDKSESEEVPYVNTDDDINEEDYYGNDYIIRDEQGKDELWLQSFIGIYWDHAD